MISIILPAYNEGLEICSSVLALDSVLAPAFPDIEIIVIDDGSTDETSDLLSDLCTDSHLVLIRNAARGGKGQAIRCGLSASQGDIIAYTDADLPISPDFIISAIETIDPNSISMCVGERLRPNSPRRRKGSAQRRLASWVFRRFVCMLFPALPKDPACCLKVFSRDLADLIRSKTTIDSYMFDVEACLIGIHAGAKVNEIPVAWEDKRPKLPWLALLHHGIEGFWSAFRLRSQLY